MACGYKINGVDADLVFAPRNGTTPAADTGYKVGGVDVSQRWHASTGAVDRIASATGYKVNGTDWQEIFRDINYVEPTGPTINTHPASGTYDEGDPMTLTVAATSSGGTLHYQWKRDTGGGYANVGTDSATYYDALLSTSDAGSYKCTVSDDNGSIDSNVATISVTPLPTYTLSVSITNNPGLGGADAGGTVGGDGSYDPGDTAHVSVTPDSNSYIEEVFLDGVSQGYPSSLDVLMNDDHTVEVVFSWIMYSLSVTAGTGGTASGGGLCWKGENVGISYSASTGYHFDHWEVISGSITLDGNSATVNSDGEVRAIFAIDVLYVEADSGPAWGNDPLGPNGENPTCVIDGSGSHNYGTNVDVVITPDNDTDIFAVDVDGVGAGAPSTVEFHPITTDHLVEVYLKWKNVAYETTATAGGSASGSGIVKKHAVVTLGYTADTGYHFTGWVVTQGSATNVSGNDFQIDGEGMNTIQAQFAPD